MTSCMGSSCSRCSWRARPNPPPVRTRARNSALLQAHLPLSGASMLCLFASSILSGPQPGCALCKLHQAGRRRLSRLRRGPGLVRLLGLAAPVGVQAVPLLARPLPRLLGTQRLGHLFVRRPRVDRRSPAAGTRGLVGDTAFAVLPEITPRTAFLLTLLCQTLPLIELFAKPSFDNFVGAVTLCGYASFLFVTRKPFSLSYSHLGSATCAPFQLFIYLL